MKIIIGLVAAAMLALALWLTGCGHSGPSVQDNGNFPTAPPASDYSGTSPQPAPYDPATDDSGAYDPSDGGAGDYGDTTDDPGFSQWESNYNENNLNSTVCMGDASAC